MSENNFKAHNEEVKAVWEAFRAGRPIRVPVTLGVNPRFLILDPKINRRGIDFQTYSTDPQVMLRSQVEFKDWVRHNLPQDQEMGLPQDGWSVSVDLQNYYEASWLGCPLQFRKGEVPDILPILSDNKKNLLFDRGIPDPLYAGSMRTQMEFFEYMNERKKDFTYKGLPIKAVEATSGTDGPFTLAASLRGATNLCMDLYLDPNYVHKLLSFLTEAIIVRIRAWRKFLGKPERSESFGLADDSVQLISLGQYKEFVLPCHKRLIQALAGKGPHSIHLCGDASRHFKTIRDELNVYSFDTGFPIDLGEMRRELGPEVRLNGGPHIELLRQGPPEAIRREVVRILRSGVMQGGKFVLREANNLAPRTPLEHLQVMYDTAKEYGRY